MEWTVNSHSMTGGQVEIMLSEIGLPSQFEDDTHIMIFCPFHSNRHSAACSVAKNTGYYFCHGASCDARGTFTELVKAVKGWDTMRTIRFIEKYSFDERPVDEILTEIYAGKDEMPVFDLGILEKLQNAYAESDRAQEYVESRNIKMRTAHHFGLGYNPVDDMIITPMFSTFNTCVGIIGRTISYKRFKNSPGLPSKKTLFNFQNARKAGSETCVVVESNFDALRVHQSGYPNVVATLGGTFSDFHLSQISRSFNKVIIGVDADEAGLKFADKISKSCKSRYMQVYRAAYSELDIFPPGAKDFGDCSDEDIAWCIRNASIMV